MKKALHIFIISIFVFSMQSVVKATQTGGAGNNNDSVTFGQVGIGTNTPLNKLSIIGESSTGDSTVASAMLGMYDTTSTNSSAVKFEKSRGTIASPSAVLDEDVLGSLIFGAYDGSSMRSDRASILSIASENWTTMNNGTALAFYTTGNGNEGSNERMRINNDGSIEINNMYTFPSSVGSQGQVLSLSDEDGTLDWTYSGGNSIWDNDIDTGVETENDTDEDILRLHAAGIQSMTINRDGGGTVLIGDTDGAGNGMLIAVDDANQIISMGDTDGGGNSNYITISDTTDADSGFRVWADGSELLTVNVNLDDGTSSFAYTPDGPTKAIDIYSDVNTNSEGHIIFREPFNGEKVLDAYSGQNSQQGYTRLYNPYNGNSVLDHFVDDFSGEYLRMYNP